MLVGESLWISQAVLLFHYAIYLPIILGDGRCTSDALWGPFGPWARVATLVCAVVAYGLHIALMWSTRDETDPGLWASSFVFYLCQSAFLQAVHDSNCRGERAFVTRTILALAAASIIWFIVTFWRRSKSRTLKYASLFLAVPFVAIDFFVYAWFAVP